MGLSNSKEQPENVKKEGNLQNSKTGKVFCWLTNSDLLLFKSKKAAYKKGVDGAISRIPLYNVTIQHCRNLLKLTLPTRVVTFKGKSLESWASEIHQVCQSEDMKTLRNTIYTQQKKFTLHVHIMEGRDIETNGDTPIVVSAQVIPKAESQDLNLGNLSNDIITQTTGTACGSSPIWGDVFSFSAAGAEDAMILKLLKSSGKKELGEVVINLSKLDLGGNPDISTLVDPIPSEACELSCNSESDPNSLPTPPGSVEVSIVGSSQKTSHSSILTQGVNECSDSDSDENVNNGSVSSVLTDPTPVNISSKSVLSTTGKDGANTMSKFIQDMDVNAASGRYSSLEGRGMQDDHRSSVDIYSNDFDFENRALGMHRWVEVFDSKKNAVVGVLHICIRAIPAEQLDDLTLSSQKFKESRITALTPDNFFLDDKAFIRPLNIYTGSWNVGNKAPSLDLSPWIPRSDYDLLIFGSQECKYEPRKGYGSCRDDWIGTLTTHVGENYMLVDAVNLMEIRLVVFCSKVLFPEISNVITDTKACGIGGVLGNKGGALMSFNVRNTRFCFLNSHLAAHQDMRDRRNQDVRDISTGINSGAKGSDLSNYFHYLFWIGDLNYRLTFGDQGMKRQPSLQQFNTMVRMVRDQKYEELFQYDQLKDDMENYRVYTGFTEGVHNFEPTFKVKRHEPLVYNKTRSPAFCDRILWNAKRGNRLVQTHFSNALDVLSSDHKPVFATFVVESYYFTHSHDLWWTSVEMGFQDLLVESIRNTENIGDNEFTFAFRCELLPGGMLSLNSSDMKKDGGVCLPITLPMTNLGRIRQYILLLDVTIKGEKTPLGYGNIPLSQIHFNASSQLQVVPFIAVLTKGTVGIASIRGGLSLQWFK